MNLKYSTLNSVINARNFSLSRTDFRLFYELHLNKEPKNLYEPIEYILHLGGKRMRPILTLMATEVFDVDCKKALPAATAIEVFHNFSLGA